MEPRKGGARVPRVVAVLSGLLERAAERGDGAAATASSSASAFRGRALPEISVRRYAERIYRYAGCSPACFVVAYVYLDRLAQQPRDLDEEEDEASGPAAAVVGVDSHTVHRLLITAVMVAAKFMDDKHYNNAYFARVGGVEVAEMNALELELLFALRFRLNVVPDTFARYCAVLEGEMLVMAGMAMGDGSDAAAVVLLVPAAAPVSVSEEEEDVGVGSRAAVPVVPRAAAVEMVAR